MYAEPVLRQNSAVIHATRESTPVHTDCLVHPLRFKLSMNDPLREKFRVLVVVGDEAADIVQLALA